jgi:integrase
MLSTNEIAELNQAQRAYARLAGILMLGAIVIAIGGGSILSNIAGNGNFAETDFLFPSVRLNGTQPLTPDVLLKRVIRPAAEAAAIRKRIGWHTFRHSLATNLRGLGVDVKVAQELLRHANSRITLDIYTQAVSTEKTLANGRATDLLLAGTLSTLPAPSVPEGENVSC